MFDIGQSLEDRFPMGVLFLCAILLTGLTSVSLRAADGKDKEDTALAASIEANPSKIKLGQPVHVTIKIKGAPKGIRYELPASLDLEPFVELSRAKDAKKSGSMQELGFTVTCFDKLGKLTLPAIKLVARSLEDGGKQGHDGLSVPPVSIEVESILGKTTDKPTPKDIADPVPIFVSDYRPLVALGLCVLWLVSGFLLLRKKKPMPVSARVEQLPPPRQAHEIALEKLEQIVAEDLPRNGKFHEYFARVSKTIREYIGNRYAFFALDLTSSELIEELRDRITPGLDLDALTRLLQEADLVKFAKAKPTDTMISFAIDTAYALIQATRIRQPEELESES